MGEQSQVVEVDQSQVEKVVDGLLREGLEGEPRKWRADAAWAAIRATGTRLWLDTGDVQEAERLWNSEFEALTTNNTLLNKEVQKGIYDELIRKAAVAIRGAGVTDQKAVLAELGFVLNAHHGLRLVREFGAHVSVELHTDLADDVEGSVAYGRRYHAICPDRFYVKVPLTPAGLIAARRLSDLGIVVNLTLGFSARQNYAAALVAMPGFVNVFMGRLNQFVAENRLGDGRKVGEKATLATQRELSRLRYRGRARSLLIGASMRDASQVRALAGVDVFTLPAKVAAEYRKAPARRIVSRVDNNPAVELAKGVRLEDFGGGVLWNVPEGFDECVDELARQEVGGLSPAKLVEHFAKAGFGDLFPKWSEEEIRTAAKDGKIPVYEKWKAALAGGWVGLDALMNLSAMQSFATDQRALDERVKGIAGNGVIGNWGW